MDPERVWFCEMFFICLTILESTRVEAPASQLSRGPLNRWKRDKSLWQSMMAIYDSTRELSALSSLGAMSSLNHKAKCSHRTWLTLSADCFSSGPQCFLVDLEVCWECALTAPSPSLLTLFLLAELWLYRTVPGQETFCVLLFIFSKHLLSVYCVPSPAVDAGM